MPSHHDRFYLDDHPGLQQFENRPDWLPTQVEAATELANGISAPTIYDSGR
jgi:hypothetical protein